VEARYNHHQKFVLESIWMHDHQEHPKNIIWSGYQCVPLTNWWLVAWWKSCCMRWSCCSWLHSPLDCSGHCKWWQLDGKFWKNNKTTQWQETCVCPSASLWNITFDPMNATSVKFAALELNFYQKETWKGFRKYCRLSTIIFLSRKVFLATLCSTFVANTKLAQHNVGHNSITVIPVATTTCCNSDNNHDNQQQYTWLQ